MPDPEEKETAMSEAESLRFLVRLAQPEEVEPLSRGGVLDLIDGLRKYLAVEGEGQIDRELRRAEKTPELLSDVRCVARRVVEAIADRKTETIEYDPGKYVIDASGPRPLTFEDSSLRDAVLHFAAADIDSDQASRIRRCPRCRRVFYGQTNAKFCSRRCASAAAVQKYRASMRKSRVKRSPKE